MATKTKVIEPGDSRNLSQRGYGLCQIVQSSKTVLGMEMSGLWEDC